MNRLDNRMHIRGCIEIYFINLHCVTQIQYNIIREDYSTVLNLFETLTRLEIV